MDHIDHVDIARHSGFEAFRATIGSRRLVLFTTKGRQSACGFRYQADDVLLFGKESGGVPTAVAEACDARLRIPIQTSVRSLNLTTAATLALGEALPPNRKSADLIRCPVPVDCRALSIAGQTGLPLRRELWSLLSAVRNRRRPVGQCRARRLSISSPLIAW